MLLQTLLQLNLLILATPALAGWSALPVFHGDACLAGIVWQYRAVEAAAPVTEALLAVHQAKIAPVPLPAPADMRVSAPAPDAALIFQCPFPHAARAP